MMKFACSNNLEHFPKRLFYQNEVKCNIERTMVLKVKKTAVLVLMPGLVDGSWSRTVPTLVYKSYMLLSSSSERTTFWCKKGLLSM